MAFVMEIQRLPMPVNILSISQLCVRSSAYIYELPVL